MKQIKRHPFLFLVATIAVFMVCFNVFAALTNTYDTSTPAGSDDPREADDRMREIKASTQERMNDHNSQTDEGDHYWPLTGTEVSDPNTGQHRMLTIRQLSGNPSALTSYAVTTDLGFLYQKDVSGNGELFWEDEADNVIQLTSGGTLFGNTMTGNVAITGTLDVTGLTELIGVATIADDSVTKTTAVADNPAEVANLATVDAQVAASITDGFTPASEADTAWGTGVTTLPNGLKMAWGSKSVSSGESSNITPSGFSIIYDVQLTIVEDDSADNFAPKIGNTGNTTFTIWNTLGGTITYRWRAIGR